MGLPVVATAAGGVRDALDHDKEGRLVPVDRPDLLPDALEMLVQDPQLRSRYGEAARQRSLGFDIHRAVGRLEELYQTAGT